MILSSTNQMACYNDQQPMELKISVQKFTIYIKPSLNWDKLPSNKQYTDIYVVIDHCLNIYIYIYYKETKTHHPQNRVKM